MSNKITKFVNEMDKESLIHFMQKLARQMNTYLEAYPEVYHKIELALNDIEKWPNKKAKELYEHLFPIAMLEDFQIDSREDKAFFSILSALYYIVWEIDNIERIQFNLGITQPLPSYMADVSRQTALDSINNARKVLGDIEEIYALMNCFD